MRKNKQRLFNKTALAIAVFFLGISLVNPVKAAEGSAEKAASLRQQMTRFFTETLEDNYHMKDKAKLYEAFLNDYCDYFQNIQTNSKIDFLTSIDTQKLDKINEQLFIRDREHYYQFYMEVIHKQMAEANTATTLDSEQASPGADTVVIRQQRVIGEPIFDSAYDLHSVWINRNFNSYIASLPTETATWLNSLMSDSQEISFYYLAQGLSQTDNRSNLSDDQVQGLVAVVFWKLLCMQSNKDFHSAS